MPEHLTLGEALTQAQREGKSIAAAEIILCKQAADYFDEMAEQIVTPRNSRGRKVLQDMALAIRQATLKYQSMDRGLSLADAMNKDLAKSLEWMIQRFQGDSGMGHGHWVQYPEYRKAIADVRAVTGINLGTDSDAELIDCNKTSIVRE